MIFVNFLTQIYNYKSLIWNGIRRDIEIKYRRSYLGFLWTILNPVSQIFIYFIIFSQIMKSKVPGIESEYSYAIFLCLGMIPWTFFSELLTRTTNVFIDNAHLLKKVSVPKIVFPIICLGSSIFNFLIFYTIFLFFTLFIKISTTAVLFNILVPMFFLSLWGLSIGLVLALLNVFIRDVGNALSIFLQFWFWLTPIVYNMNTIPQKYLYYLAFNPVNICILASQSVMFNDVNVEYVSFIYPSFISVFFFVIAYFLYVRLAEKLSDEL